MEPVLLNFILVRARCMQRKVKELTFGNAFAIVLRKVAINLGPEALMLYIQFSIYSSKMRSYIRFLRSSNTIIDKSAYQYWEHISRDLQSFLKLDIRLNVLVSLTTTGWCDVARPCLDDSASLCEGVVLDISRSRY